MIRAMLLGLICVAVPAQASDSEISRRSLKGLDGIFLLVEVEAHERAGFDVTRFRTDIELKLRMAGIRLQSEEEHHKTAGFPYLYVNIHALHESKGEAASYSVLVELNQFASLDRDPSVVLPTATWSKNGVGTGTMEAARRFTKDVVENFINAWLSVNPKK